MSDADEVLGAESKRRLAHVLDTIVPPAPERGLPGAGELGVADYIEQIVTKSPELGPALQGGLDAADAAARERGSEDFGALSLAERAEVLSGLDATAPGFVPVLLFHGYTAYYQDGRVMEKLGLEPRPPHPKGYLLETGDLSLLERVKARGPLYREV